MFNPAAIAATGGGLFMLGFGLLLQKVKKIPEDSFLAHYLSPVLLLALGTLLFISGMKLT